MRTRGKAKGKQRSYQVVLQDGIFCAISAPSSNKSCAIRQKIEEIATKLQQEDPELFRGS